MTTEYVTPNIHTVLKKYQNTAPKSLQGPGHALVAAAAATASGCPGGVNCPLDVSINSGDLSSSVNSRALSPCIAANLTTPSNGLGGIGGIGGSSKQIPAVALIKKEILSSPEPLPLSSQSTSSSSSSSTSSSIVASHGHGISDMQQQHHGLSNSPPTIKIVPPPPPELSQPILSAADSCSGELYETRLEGKTIGCFSLGGEMRLCLPQFLNNVLGDFTLDQINRIFDELGIFCSQCTPDQLIEFKAAKILPSDVKASGLITRTDAERLCAALLHRSDRSSYISIDIPKSAISFKVYHRCFGKCEGICTPDMYSYANPTCIMCLECKGWFSPQKFVGHVHRKVENRTCHWGFDSRNWHDYLHVALDVENREKYQKILDQLKEVETKESMKQQQQREINFMKRKGDIPFDDILIGSSIPGSMLSSIQAPVHQMIPSGKQRGASEILDIPSKKGKNLDEASAYQLEYQRYQTLMYAHCAQQQRMGSISAFRPWAPPKSFLQAAAAASYNAAVVGAFSTLPYLSQEPPVLQNPERVVRNADRERFERTYQPNVALAPRKNILNKEREKEQRERERERIDRERERELERVRERERERSRERERERERQREQRDRRELQQQQQQQQQQKPQQQQIFQPHAGEQICGGGCTNLCEAEVHIKQERASTPQSPLLLSNSAEDDAIDRRSASILHEEATMPMISPMSLSISQQHQQQLKSSTIEMSQRRHSVHTSNTPSACSTSSSITPPEQQLLPAHLPPLPIQPQLRHLQHLTITQQNLRQSPRTPSPTNNNTNCNSNRNNLEEFASSNEITSSTSPVPPTNKHLRQQHHQASAANTSHQQHIMQQQQQPQPAHVQSIIATVNQHAKLLPTSTASVSATLPTTFNNTNNNEISSRIRINKNLMRSPTTPPPSMHQQQQQQHQEHLQQQQQFEYFKEKENQQQRLYAQHQHQQRQQHNHYIRHQQHQQHHSPTQSSSGGLNLSTNSTSIKHQHQQYLNGLQQPPHMGSEFELSTDTDDDSSLNGEPDSSNMLAPWEMAVEALRDTRPKDRERVLQLLQRLLQENQQYRYNNLQLSEILQKRDAHICELREQIQNYRRQLETERKQHQEQSAGEFSSSIIGKADSFQSEELRVPLKKSIRRDPERTEKREEQLMRVHRVARLEEKQVQRPNGMSQSTENYENSSECSENPASTVSKNTKDEESESEADRMEVVPNKSRKESTVNVVASGNQSQVTSYVNIDEDAIEIKCEASRLSNGHHDVQDETSPFSGSDVGSEKDCEDTSEVTKGKGNNEVNEKDEEDDEDENADGDDIMDDDEDDEVERNCIEQNSQNLVQAPHTNAAVTPPTATTPISPDSAATAGQLFDSSNSSDDSSMKKAQMSASNALAKMTEVEAQERGDVDHTKNDHKNLNDNDEDTINNADVDADADDNSTRSDVDEESMESEDINSKHRTMKREHDHSDDAQDELFGKKRHQKTSAQESNIIFEPTIKITAKSTPTLLIPKSHATTIPPTCTVSPKNFTPIATKASRKQTPASPTTNTDLQIKKEIF